MKQADSPLLSVIVPALNELDNLPRLLDELRSQEGVKLDIIVADGGSTDGSLDWLQHQIGVRVVKTRRGRGRQMNSGAALARYPALLFLHADSSLGAPDLLAKALDAWRTHGDKSVAGHFKLRFEAASAKRRFRYLEGKSASNRPETINGDQGLLIHCVFFRELGGFDESFPFMEDQALAKQIHCQGEWMLLPGQLTTSTRRFEREGFYRRYLLMGMMMAFYWTGAHSFFERARNVYPEQGETSKLRLWPFFKTAWAVLLRDLRPAQALRLCFAFGRYARQNLWQLFFFVDIYLLGRKAEKDMPCTNFFDRRLRPILGSPLVDALLTPFVIICFFLLLAPAFFLLDAVFACRLSAQPSQASKE